MDELTLQHAQEAFRDAHRIAGGHSALARVCECTPPNIQQLLERGSPLPVRFVLKVEAATGISRHDLRPDIYPREDEPHAAAGEDGSGLVGGSSDAQGLRS